MMHRNTISLLCNEKVKKGENFQRSNLVLKEDQENFCTKSDIESFIESVYSS